jgi:hypothetical protein
LQVADLGPRLQPKPLFFWRMFMQYLLAACSDVQQVWQCAGPDRDKHICV